MVKKSSSGSKNIFGFVLPLVLMGLVILVALAIAIYIGSALYTSQSSKQPNALTLQPPTRNLSINFTQSKFSLYTLSKGGDRTTTLHRLSLEATQQEGLVTNLSDQVVSDFEIPIQSIVYSSPSPNGNYIALTERKNGYGDTIWLVNLRTGKNFLLPKLGEFEQVSYFLSWLQDGLHVLVQSQDQQKLWIINVENGEKQSIVFNASVVDAVGTPDGREVAVLLYFGSGLGGEIWSTNLDGSERKLILKEPNKTLVSPALSKDGEFIAFYKTEDILPMTTELFVMKSDGSSVKSIGFVAGSFRFHPIWNPNQNLLTYIVRDNEVKESADILDIQRVESSIVTMDPATREKKIFSSGRRNIDPSWSPDGKLLAFISNKSGINEIWIADQSGNSVQVTNDGQEKRFPIWMIEDQIIK